MTDYPIGIKDTHLREMHNKRSLDAVLTKFIFSERNELKSSDQVMRRQFPRYMKIPHG